MHAYIHTYIYIYIYVCSPPPPPHDHGPHIWPREAVGLGGLSCRGLRTPDFQNDSGAPPDSRLQTPDFQNKSGVSGPWTPESGVRNLESGVPVLQIHSGKSRFTLEIWSLESGAPVLQIHSGNLESGVLESGAPVLQIHSGNLESGVRGSGTPDSLWKSGVWSPGPVFSRCTLRNTV